MSDYGVTFMAHKSDPNGDGYCSVEPSYCAGCNRSDACEPALHIHANGFGYQSIGLCSEACAITWVQRHASIADRIGDAS